MLPLVSPAQAPVRISHETPPALPPAASPRRSIWALLAGVALPVVTIAFELATGLCAAIFYDPVPSAWHVALVATVPLANPYVWIGPRRGLWNSPAALSAANAAALIVAGYYSIRFLPVVPLGLIGLAVIVGLLPLTPMVSLWATFWMRRNWLRSGPMRRAVAAAIAAVALLEGPAWMAHTGVALYRDGSETARRHALRLLRCCGSEDVLRDTDDRILYYLATGKQWGEEPVAGLTLAGSRMDGVVEPTASMGYVEWTLTLRNASRSQQEARSTVLLPPGGVVSRATLWVHGEEREAAFGGRAQTTQAYERVVATRRDPLLVVTSGPDRVEVRCFPVEPRGAMKIRLGVTAPLEGGKLWLPRLAASNFVPAAGLEHSLRIDAPGRQVQRRTEHLPESLDFPGGVQVSFTADPREPERYQIVQRPDYRLAEPVQRLIVVVQGSAALRPRVGAIRDEIEKASRHSKVDLLVASDETLAPRWLSASQLHGGADSEPALRRAQEIAADHPASAILWIHGPQPLIEGGGALRQFLLRRPGVAPLFAFQAAPGANDLLTELENVPDVKIARGTLEAAFAEALGLSRGAKMVRERVRAAKDREGRRASLHLARLWADEEARRLARSERFADRAAALALSRQFQLVTPVSGAVVLETNQQYTDAGLTPGDPSPVPEPSTWLLFGTGLGSILGLRWWSRRVTGPRYRKSARDTSEPSPE